MQKHCRKKLYALGFKDPFDFLKDIAEIWHINKSGVHSIFSHFKKLLFELRKNKKLMYKTEEILGYCLYYYINTNNCPYTPDDIAQILNKPSYSFLTSIQAQLKDSTQSQISKFVNKICNNLEFDFKTKTFITEICRKHRFSHSLYHPKTYCLIIITWFCKIYYPNIKNKQLSQAANSGMSYIKKLQKKETVLQKKVEQDLQTFTVK